MSQLEAASSYEDVVRIQGRLQECRYLFSGVLEAGVGEYIETEYRYPNDVMPGIDHYRKALEG